MIHELILQYSITAKQVFLSHFYEIGLKYVPKHESFWAYHYNFYPGRATRSLFSRRSCPHLVNRRVRFRRTHAKSLTRTIHMLRKHYKREATLGIEDTTRRTNALRSKPTASLWTPQVHHFFCLHQVGGPTGIQSEIARSPVRIPIRDTHATRSCGIPTHKCVTSTSRSTGIPRRATSSSGT